ncbi:MAG TPA: N-acetylmuramoyl-L-alanine amidase [Mycobacteriales bacterium]|nr:N-acetylmuramoyl-L-alanine amidase [Mycobacteriales bacterium]
MRRAVRRGAALVMIGFVGVLVATVGVAGARNAPATVSDQRQREITAAATASGVPAPLLVALAGTLSGFGATTDPAVDGGHGLFRLTDRAASLDGRGGSADTRGDRARALAAADPATGTLAAAAAAAHVPASRARDVPADNAKAAAALLRSYALEAGGGALPTSLVGWYGAVARFATGEAMTGRAVADDVFALLRRGVPATVVGGQRFSVPAQPGAAVPAAPATVTGECPASCRLVPAAGYRPADRAEVGQVVVSTAPAGYTATIAAAQRPSARWSPHYVVRAADGAVTQTVLLRDVAWDAGNPTVDDDSVGIAVEADPGPAAYRSVAGLLRLLATRGLTLDRAHVLGADEVAGSPVTLQAGFDWARVLRLAGAPLTARAFRADRVVTVAAPGLVLRDAPDGAALPHQPAVGRSLAVAGTEAGWTKVWYGGRAAYLTDPAGTRTLPGDADRITPVSAAVPVHAAATGASATEGTLGTGQTAVLLDPNAVGDYLAIGFGEHIGYVAATDVALSLG